MILGISFSIRRDDRLLYLPSISIGVEAEIADSELSLAGKTGSDAGEDFRQPRVVDLRDLLEEARLLYSALDH